PDHGHRIPAAQRPGFRRPRVRRHRRHDARMHVPPNVLRPRRPFRPERPRQAKRRPESAVGQHLPGVAAASLFIAGFRGLPELRLPPGPGGRREEKHEQRAEPGRRSRPEQDRADRNRRDGAGARKRPPPPGVERHDRAARETDHNGCQRDNPLFQKMADPAGKPPAAGEYKQNHGAARAPGRDPSTLRQVKTPMANENEIRHPGGGRREPSPAELLRIIFDYTAKISGERNLDRILMLMADMGREMVVADRCTVWLADHQRNELWTKVAHGVDELRIPMGDGLVGYAVARNEAVFIDDAYTNEEYRAVLERGALVTDRRTGYRTKALMVIPFSNSEGEVVGCYQAVNK